jgi:predicted ATP-grasp superfamily ATP-dependent carboligase
LAIGAYPIASHSVAPLATEKDRYLKFILDLVEAKRIDFVFPIHDEEIRVLLKARDSGSPLPMSSNSGRSVEICTDKLEMARRCSEWGIPAPKTLVFEEFAADPFFPVFSKPRQGVGSTNVHTILHEDDFKKTVGQKDLIYQELCSAPELTVDVLATEFGTVAVARERIEIKAGVATKCKVWSSVDIHDLAERVSRAFNLKGLFCFQVMTQNGHLVVTDINPRSGGATAMTLAAGVNLYDAYFRGEFEGYRREDVIALKEAALSLQPVFVARYFEEHVNHGIS